MTIFIWVFSNCNSISDWQLSVTLVVRKYLLQKRFWKYNFMEKHENTLMEMSLHKLINIKFT